MFDVTASASLPRATGETPPFESDQPPASGSFGQFHVSSCTASEFQGPPSNDSKVNNPQHGAYRSDSPVLLHQPCPTPENSPFGTVAGSTPITVDDLIARLSQVAQEADHRQPATPTKPFVTMPCDTPKSPFSGSPPGPAELEACQSDNIPALQSLLHNRPAGIHRFQKDKSTKSNTRDACGQTPGSSQ